mmetsp:Transcript_4408/g.4836  ORF Transcript_4408/g.4836 Transcript_4408/m.4836 type:complete len:484 (+) Transcript_4408:32-1483(+)
MYLLLVVVVLVLAIVGRIFIWPYIQYSGATKLPGPPRHILFGTSHGIPLEKVMENHVQRNIQYDYVFRQWLGPSLVLACISDPKYIKPLMKSSVNVEKGMGYFIIRPWLRDGLLLSSGSKWKTRRRLLTPGFHYNILKGYVRLAANKAKEFADIVASKHLGQYIEVQKEMTHLSLDIVGLCAFNSDFNATSGQSEYVKAVEEISSMAELWIRNLPFLQNHSLFKLTSTGSRYFKAMDKMHAHTSNIIKNRMRELKESTVSNTKKLDFLDILLECRNEDGKPLDFLSIHEEVDTFLFEGHDTTGHSLSWALYCLANNPEAQRKAQEEVDKILGDKKFPEYEDLVSFKYLTLCIKETMRLYPAVPFIMRDLKEPLTLKNTVMAPGSMIQVSAYALHRNPTVWPEPEKFMPERFLESPKPFTYIPFSAGPRNCIGQNFAMHEMIVVLAMILRVYNIELDPEHKVIPVFRLILKSLYGVKVKFTKRT